MRKTALLTALIILVFSCAVPVYAETGWDCPECGRKGNTGKFCGTCAYPSPSPKPEATPTPKVRKVTVGKPITFGHYEQDNDLNNGKEPIEWTVLDVQDGKALLLSRYGLDAKPYNTEDTDVTWEKCTLRSWLNGEFLNKAFSKAERSAILMTKVDNRRSQGYSKWNTDGGNNTEDWVFLLSYAEANRYLGVEYWEVSESSQNAAARVAPTAYALGSNAYTNSNHKTSNDGTAGCWWLRSPGKRQRDAAGVATAGSLYFSSVSYGFFVVRPALWINLESFQQ